MNCIEISIILVEMFCFVCWLCYVINSWSGLCNITSTALQNPALIYSCLQTSQPLTSQPRNSCFITIKFSPRAPSLSNNIFSMDMFWKVPTPCLWYFVLESKWFIYINSEFFLKICALAMFNIVLIVQTINSIPFLIKQQIYVLFACLVYIYYYKCILCL